MSLTQRFIESCDHADNYPINLVGQETFVDYNLTDYLERLNDRASELFSPEDKGYLRFWNYDGEEQSKLILEVGGFTGQSLIKCRI